MKLVRITSQCQPDVPVLQTRGREEGGTQREKGGERKRARERKRWGLFELSELKSLSFFTIETDSYNMW